MVFSDSFKKNIIFLLIISKILCQKLSLDNLGGWGEKPIPTSSDLYHRILETTQKYIVSEGYTLDETDIIPFGLFKQSLNGINYRIICAVKKKTNDVPTIYDILMHSYYTF